MLTYAADGRGPIRLIAIASLTLIVGAGNGLAQGTGKVTPRRPVSFAIVEEFPTLPQNYPAAVVRYPNGTDMILIRKGQESPMLLDAAARAVADSRARYGSQLTRVKGGKIPQRVVLGVKLTPRKSNLTETQVARLVEILSAVQKAPLRELPGVGRVRVVSFFPPIQQRKP